MGDLGLIYYFQNVLVNVLLSTQVLLRHLSSLLLHRQSIDDLLGLREKLDCPELPKVSSGRVRQQLTSGFCGQIFPGR